MTDKLETNELDSLKARADMMGVGYHPKIGLEKLKAKVNDAMTDAVKKMKNLLKKQQGKNTHDCVKNHHV